MANDYSGAVKLRVQTEDIIERWFIDLVIQDAAGHVQAARDLLVNHRAKHGC